MVYIIMILTFASVDIEGFFFDNKVPKGAGWVHVRNLVRRKLQAVDAAIVVSDLRAPPGNKLEALKGSWKGFYSIRVNDQWRIVFRWAVNAKGPSDVNVVDYH
jgi:proteic killer suppression protein